MVESVVISWSHHEDHSASDWFNMFEHGVVELPLEIVGQVAGEECNGEVRVAFDLFLNARHHVMVALSFPNRSQFAPISYIEHVHLMAKGWYSKASVEECDVLVAVDLDIDILSDPEISENDGVRCNVGMQVRELL